MLALHHYDLNVASLWSKPLSMRRLEKANPPVCWIYLIFLENICTVCVASVRGLCQEKISIKIQGVRMTINNLNSFKMHFFYNFLAIIFFLAPCRRACERKWPIVGAVSSSLKLNIKLYKPCKPLQPAIQNPSRASKTDLCWAVSETRISFISNYYYYVA